MINYELLKFLETILGEYKESSNTNYKFHCPNKECNSHNEQHKFKLEINLDKEDIDYGKYHCWVCGIGGVNLITLFKKLKLEGIKKLTELYKYINKDENKTTIKITKQLYNPDNRWDINIKNILNKSNDINDNNEITIKLEDYGIISLYNRLLIYKEELQNTNQLNDIELDFNTQNILNYLSVRNITLNDIIKYNIHYCITGDYSHRIIFPSMNNNGKFNYFVGRNYIDEMSINKYKNSKLSKDIIFNEYLIDFNFPIVLCEGVFDAIAIRRNAIPLLGKNIQPKLLQKLIQYKPNIYIFLDNDAINDSYKLANLLLKNGIDNVFVVIPPKLEDPSSLGFERCSELIKNTKQLKNNNFNQINMIKNKLINLKRGN